MAKKMALFACMECGRKFSTARVAQRAVYNGCPKCGGVDIDLDVPAQQPLLTTTPPAGGPVCRCNGGKVCPRHGHA